MDTGFHILRSIEHTSLEAFVSGDSTFIKIRHRQPGIDNDVFGNDNGNG